MTGKSSRQSFISNRLTSHHIRCQGRFNINMLCVYICLVAAIMYTVRAPRSAWHPLLLLVQTWTLCSVKHNIVLPGTQRPRESKQTLTWPGSSHSGGEEQIFHIFSIELWKILSKYHKNCKVLLSLIKRYFIPVSLDLQINMKYNNYFVVDQSHSISRKLFFLFSVFSLLLAYW